jgi:exportin-T
MASIEQAISVLFDPRQPEHVKKSAMSLTELAKQDPFFYKFAMQKISELSNEAKQSLNLYFWYFQALEEQIRKFYPSFPIESRMELHSFLSSILETRIDILQVHISILNKFAVLYVRVIQEDFPTIWPSAFSLLMQKIKTGPEYVKLFLSVLKVFSEEFTEELGSMTQEQLCKSNALKDAMREGVLNQAAEIWREILASQDQSLVSGTLKVMTAYISWIPLEVTLAFFPYFCEYLKIESTQVPALQCIDSLVNKKMDPNKKLQVIQQLNLLDFVRNFSFESFDMLSDLPKTMSIFLDSLGEHLLDLDETPELQIVFDSGLKCLNHVEFI